MNNPVWIDDKGKIVEPEYCRDFLSQHPMRCINDRFYTVDGPSPDESKLKRTIYEEISPWLHAKVAQSVEQIIKALKLAAYADPLPLQCDRIHVANGTCFLDGRFTEEKEYCSNRLPVSYRADAPAPEHWLRFLSELLEPEDIPALQEYLGYCLIPSTKGQKMLMRCRIAYEHIAEGSAVIDGDADAEGIAVWVDHRCQVAGGVLPVCHSLLRNLFWVHDRECCQVGPETVGIPRRRHSLTFRSVIMLGVQVGGTFLCRIHERLIHRQFWNAAFPPHFVDAPDHLLTNLHLCRWGADCLHRGSSGIRRIRVDLHAVLPIHIESYLLTDIPEPHEIIPRNVIGGHGDLLAIYVDFLPSRFRYDSRCGFAHQSCANGHASQQREHCFLFAHPLVLLVLVLQTQHTESTGGKLLKDAAFSDFLRKYQVLSHGHIPATILLFPMIILPVAVGETFLP